MTSKLTRTQTIVSRVPSLTLDQRSNLSCKSPWFAPDDPDPMGFKFRIVRQALTDACSYLEGLFLVRA